MGVNVIISVGISARVKLEGIQVFVLAKNFDHMKEKICLPSEDFTANVVENSSHFGMHKWMQWILMYFFGFKGKKVIYNIDKKAPNRWTDDEPTNASQGDNE